VVFEGPDGVGKSDLAARFHGWLEKNGVTADLLSFPGKQEGTLGRLVYELHSNPARFDVSALTPTSLQALHIAAHLDTIEQRIIPSLRLGRTVVLDRFWWSTQVYGIATEVDLEVLSRLIGAEKATWGFTKPAALFLIDRSKPLRLEPSEFWVKCRNAYRHLLSAERTHYPCETIANEGSIEQTLSQLIQSWHSRRENTIQEEP